MFKEYEEANSKSMSGTLNKQRAEELYVEARRLFYEKFNKSDQVLVVEDELSQRTASLELSMKRQEEQLQETRGTLQAYSVNDKQCHFCKALGHFKRNCPKLKNKGNYNDKSREGFQKRKGPPYVYCVDFSESTVKNKSDVDNNSDAAVFLHVKINNKNCDILIDSGAGPCVIDLAVLKEWNLFNKIKRGEGGRNLYGLGISKIIGTIVLKFQLLYTKIL